MRKSLHFEGMHNLSAQPVNLLIPVDSDEHALLTVIAYHGPGQLIVYRNAVSTASSVSSARWYSLPPQTSQTPGTRGGSK